MLAFQEISVPKKKTQLKKSVAFDGQLLVLF